MAAGKKVVLSSSAVIYYLIHALLISVGAFLCTLENAIWLAVGTSMIATGAAGIFLFLYISRTEADRQALESYRETGLNRVYLRRAAQIREEYACRLRRAHKNVDLAGFGLKDFRRDYLERLGEISARAQVRILLIDPENDLPAMRDSEEGQSPGTIEEEVREFLRQFEQRYTGAPPPGLAIRLYTCLPSVNIFRIDDDVFWGPYLVGRASGNTMTLRARRGGSMFDQLEEHFDEIWNNHSRAAF